MTTFARGLAAISGLVVLPVACAVFAGACGNEPVGVEPCRVIETARCEALKSCGSSETDVTYCIAFYRDQCLHGFANTAAEISSESTNACIDAIGAVSSCAATGAMSMTQCSAISLVSGTDPVTTKPCTIIDRTPQVLTACAFLSTEESAGSSSSSTSSSSSSSGDMPDGGDDAGDGG